MTTESPARSFDLGQALGDAFGALRQNWVVYLVLSAVFVGLPSLAGVLLYDKLLADGVITLRNVGSIFAGSYLRTVAVALIAVALQGAMIHGVAAYLEGRRAGFDECLSAAFRNWPPLLAISIIHGVCVTGASLLLVVPGAMLAMAWYVIAPVRVIEGAPITSCFGRSADLTRGRRWSLFGFAIVVALIGFGIGLGAGLLGGFIAGFIKGLAGARFDAQILINPPIEMFSFCLQSAVWTTAYSQLAGPRRETEALASVFA